MATHSSISAQRILWTEEPGGVHRVSKGQTQLKWLSTYACIFHLQYYISFRSTQVFLKPCKCKQICYLASVGDTNCVVCSDRPFSKNYSYTQIYIIMVTPLQAPFWPFCLIEQEADSWPKLDHIGSLLEVWDGDEGSSGCHPGVLTRGDTNPGGINSCFLARWTEN